MEMESGRPVGRMTDPASPGPRISPGARALPPTDAWAWSDEALAARLHPLYRDGLERVPGGPLVSRGLPFELPPAGLDARWLVVDRPVEIDLDGHEASHVVLLAFCDAWRDEAGERPVGVPVGWVMPVGEALAQVEVRTIDGPAVTTVLRRRFEVNEGIVGWGSMAFLAVPHLAEAPIPWQGPHARLPEGRLAPAGHTGPLGVLPSSWGASQTGVQDHVPSPANDLMMWLHVIELSREAGPRRLGSMRLEPVPGSGDGRLVVVGAITTFIGTASPLRWSQRRSVRVGGARDLTIDVDLGILARRRPIPGPRRSRPGDVTGWGVTVTADSVDEEIEIAVAEDARLTIGTRAVAVAELEADGGSAHHSGTPSVRWMSPVDRRSTIELVHADGSRAPARVRATAPDGRYLAPLGHRDEINPGLNEDLGADALIAGSEYAYVDGSFEIDVPADGAHLEVVSGQQRPTLSADLSSADLRRGVVRLTLPDALAPGEGVWISGDTHVHYLAPSTALLQAAAEGINVVHLLATQWGDHHTNVTDFGADIVDPDRRLAVFVGSENRQNLLGHLVLVGADRPILPFASGGPPEGRIGGAASVLLADWLQRCRAAGGLAIGAHFPLPMAEVAADIEWGLLDALEFETLDPTLQSPPVREWYRYLGAGHRLPIVGGTDKMSATVPLGQVRTWARIDADSPLTFESWAGAIRAGRTFVSSGPILELRVDGHGIGETLPVTRGATLEVELVARAAQPIISDVELVVDGRVVWAESSAEPVTTLSLRHRFAVERTGWLAGRSRSPYAIGSAVATAMAAHTSPVYLECADAPRRPADISVPMALIDGTRAWLDHVAPVRDPADAARIMAFLDEAARRLRARA